MVNIQRVLLKPFGLRRKHQAQVPEEWSFGASDSDEASRTSRLVCTGPGSAAVNDRFCGNDIYTAKYNVVTFLPIFLFTMFSRVAYLYFLSQCALAWWSTVSPFSPYGPTIALCFVLGVAAIKAILEDRKRHQEDHKTNSSTAHLVLDDGSIKDVHWREVKVGQILEVRDNEDFPADLLCLACARSDEVAYIRTTNLDGESNLKIRRPVDLGHDTPQTAQAAVALRALLQFEPPNADLHSFTGRLSYSPHSGKAYATIGVTSNEILLRGTTLKNSDKVHGLVIYTGPETRIQMNSAAPPRKLGSFDAFLNKQISLVLIMQVALCISCAVGSYAWREHYGNERYYLALNVYTQGNYKNGGTYVAILFLTFWILFSYTVPISLFVTMEIIKFILSTIFITLDPKMRDRLTRELPKARNSDIIEDLGVVDYIFSDKTGTLTSNEMQLRAFSLKGVSYGNAAFKLEKQSHENVEQNLALFDERLGNAVSSIRRKGFSGGILAAGGSHEDLMALGTSDPADADGKALERLKLPAATPSSSTAIGSLMEDPLAPGSRWDGGLQGAPDKPDVTLLLGHHALDLWICLCICHNLITQEGAEDGRPAEYQGPSPDEVGLVEGGRQLGFEFVSRTRNDLTLRMLGHRIVYKILNVLDFTSSRARMSVIARAPDGSIRLYCKGADNVLLPRLRKGSSAAMLQATHENLRLYSIQGLRTLVVCSRVLSEAEWQAFNRRYQAAAADLDHRDKRIAEVAEVVERDLELLGVTAIEDKLQEGVPDAIRTLIAAGIRVWMITGDKQETAINIAISCKLIRRPDNVLLCNAAGSRDAARSRLQQLLETIDKAQSIEFSHDASQGAEMVIDGMTLAQILGGDEEEIMLASLAVRCSGVIVCRASPAQKAAIVLLMKRYHARVEGGQGKTGVARWLQVLSARMYAGLSGKHAGSSMRMLAVGDGANDVAMIQAAHIGCGIMGHEGRQAVNNSDFAVSQFRYLVRLLLVHGTLAQYRLGRLIKYSFYKNIAFAYMLFFYQIFCGWSGQALLDGVTAAFYNAVFTALPIAAFAIWDRPARNLDTLMRFPQAYNQKPSPELTARAFWKNSVMWGIVHGAVVFFVPYFSVAAKGHNTMDDVFSLGKTMFIALIGVVTLEVALVSRFWTRLFALVWSLSYILTFPWLVIVPLLYQAFKAYQVAQYGIANVILTNANFWLPLALVYIITFSLRLTERAIYTLFRPADTIIFAEAEREAVKRGGPMSAKAGIVEIYSMNGGEGELHTTSSLAHTPHDVSYQEGSGDPL